MNRFIPHHDQETVNTLLTAIFDDSEIGIIIADPSSGKIEAINQAGAEMFGMKNPADAKGKPWSDFLRVALSNSGTDRLHKALEKNNAYTLETEFKNGNGQAFWAYSHLSTFHSQNRKLLLLKVRNIDRDKQTEINLRLEKQRFEALFKYATMGILVTNDSGKIVMVNSFILSEFRYEEEEMLGKRVEQLIPARFHKNHTDYRKAYYHDPETRPMGAGRDLFALRKDGSEFPVEISLSPFQTSEGLFVIAFIVDISTRKEKEYADRKHHEEITKINARIKKLNDELEAKVTERTLQLEEAMKELEKSRDEILNSLEKEKELNDMKSRFVSMASHEFRTPLSTILSSASLLSKYELTEEQSKRDKHIHRIKSAVNNLTGILNEFLSLGRIEDGKIEAHFSRFNLQELISTICTEMEDIEKKGQAIRYHHSGPAEINLDMELLRNVLINLLSNAVKFSPEDAVIRVESACDKHGVTISVKDQGMGISKEDQEHLFERFFRGKNVLNIQGTGLGLHIVGKYVELMEGKITFTSQLSGGTEFTLNFNAGNGSDSLPN